MTIQVTASSPAIAVSASGSAANAAVSATSVVAVSVSGGQGPQGEPGQITSLGNVPGVSLTNPSDGDVLRYSSNAWRNEHESTLVDGGNFG